MSVLRDPMVHFLALGAALFAAYAWLSPPEVQTGAMSGDAAPRLVVDAARQEALAEGFEAVWKRPPTEAELAALVEDFIDGWVLVREARALGLDRGDAVVDQRLRQKMTFILEGAAVPSEGALEAFYAENAERYRLPASLAFAHVFLGPEPPADLASLQEDLAAGADPRGLGVPTLLPAVVEMTRADIIDRQFGDGFAARIEALAAGVWGGPVRSAYGLHLVRPAGTVAPRVPPFEAVRDRVRADWEAETRRAALEEGMAALRARYDIEIARAPDAPAGGPAQ